MRSSACSALMLLLLLGVLALAPGKGWAASGRVAVLDLDAYELSFEDAQLVSQGIRDGFLEVGVLDPMDGFEIVDRLSEGQDAQLDQARRLLSDARKKAETPGGARAALGELAQVLEIHERARSWVTRRPELADAHYFTALALARAGRTADAVSQLVEVLYLYPGYDEKRVPGGTLPGVLRPLVEQARQELRRQGPRSRAGPELADIGQALGVDYVVVGYATGSGEVHLEMYRDGQLVADADGRMDIVPMPPGDPFYTSLAQDLCDALGGAGAEAPSTGFTAVPELTSEPGEEEFPSLPGDEELLPPEDEPIVDLDEEEPLSSQANSSRPRRSRAGRIRSRGAIRYNNRPVTQRWWFWTGLGTLAAGGGVYLYVQSKQGEPETETREGNHYTLSVDASEL